MTNDDNEYSLTDVECGNCGATLCRKEVETVCWNCNHGQTDTACANYGDGHCKCCGKCLPPRG